VRPVALLVPGRIDTRTGGTIYDRRMAEGLGALGWVVDVHTLDASFPRPTAAALAHAGEVVEALPEGGVALIDSLALGAMPALVERARTRGTVVALMHLPLIADPAIDAQTAGAFAVDEGRALAAADHVVVTGAAALDLLSPYQIDPSRLTIVEPGTDPAPLARGSDDGVVHLLSVATVHAGKGHETLLGALGDAAVDGWHLTCAGSLTRDEATAAHVVDTARRLHLEDRVRFAGDLAHDALAGCYDAADVFVLATRRETYGMAVAEALARGLPIVATRTGAIPALVGASAGLLVDVDDRRGLAEALRRVITTASLRAALAAGARERRGQFPTWEHACRRMAQVLEALT